MTADAVRMSAATSPGPAMDDPGDPAFAPAGPTPAGPTPAGPTPAGPTPAGPTPAAPTPAAPGPADAAVSAQLGWCAVPDVFTPAECAWLIGFMEAALAARAADPGGLARGRRHPGVRRADVAWLADGPETGWVATRLAELVARVNRERYGFALDGFDEEVQLTRYPAAVAGFYDWHVDRGASGLAARRKLSVSVQLDVPDAYEGGALELDVGGRPVAAPRARGTAIAFPSFALHRVAPVTAGVRHALVSWVHGPDFV